MDQAKFHAPRLYNTTFVENKKDEIEEVTIVFMNFSELHAAKQP